MLDVWQRATCWNVLVDEINDEIAKILRRLCLRLCLLHVICACCNSPFSSLGGDSSRSFAISRFWFLMLRVIATELFRLLEYSNGVVVTVEVLCVIITLHLLDFLLADIWSLCTAIFRFGFSLFGLNPPNMFIVTVDERVKCCCC